jgi:hypothetical protein
VLLDLVGTHEGAGRAGETAGGAAAEAAGVWQREARGGRIVTLRKCPLVAWASIANRQAAAMPALAASLRPARLRRVGALQLAADEVAPTALLAVRLRPKAKAKTVSEEAAEKAARAALVATGVAPPALPPPPAAQPVLLAATLGTPGRLVAWEAYAGIAPRLPGGSNDANGTAPVLRDFGGDAWLSVGTAGVNGGVGLGKAVRGSAAPALYAARATDGAPISDLVASAAAHGDAREVRPSARSLARS